MRLSLTLPLFQQRHKVIQIVLPLQRLGKLLLVVLAFLLLSSCRDSVPPKIEICILDGTGGADCVEADGSQVFKVPSQLNNYWATNQPDEANFSTWCYDTTPSNVKTAMDNIKAKTSGHYSYSQ